MSMPAVLLTPPGSGGVAVVALRGDGAAELLATLVVDPRGTPLRVESASSPAMGRLRLSGEDVDDVLVVRREEGFELHLHGSPAVMAALEREIGRLRPTVPSPADALLRAAAGQAQLALALEQRGYDFDRHLAELAALPSAERQQALVRTWNRSRVAIALATPTRVVLCGRQNAGKSTLMNRLLFAERVMTGGTPGLTRDPVREHAVLAGYPFELVDTAGEGEADGVVDRRALERARTEREGAVLLVVVDGSLGPAEFERGLVGPRTLFVRAKGDLPVAPWPVDLQPMVAVRALDTDGAGMARAAVGHALLRMLALPPAGPVGGPAALTVAQQAALEALTATTAPSAAGPG